MNNFLREISCAYHIQISAQEYLFATSVYLFASAASVKFIFLIITETSQEQPKGKLAFFVLIHCEIEAQKYGSKLEFSERYI